MTIEIQLDLYQSGALTTSGFASQIWRLVTDSTVESVLGVTPPEVIDDLKDYILAVRTGKKPLAFHGQACPTDHQVELAEQWIKAVAEQQK